MNPSDTPTDDRTSSANPAADLIRQKLRQVYADEPSAREELQESQTTSHRSEHQRFMYELSQSGKSLAEIQTAWHNYYVDLPDTEKHRVWQEFYAEHDRRRKQATLLPIQHQPATSQPEPRKQRTRNDPRSVGDIKQQLLGHLSSQTNRRRGGHLKSLLFGLSSGSIVVVILLFSFFNERFIAPFITPSKSVSATPIIIDPTNSDVGPDPEIIIPKINAELPVIYTEPSIADAAIQNALQNGVVHYATTSNPGELGNGAIFGHSSNNILNKGKYKFAFVLLHRLEIGDTFMLQKDGKRYVYQVFAKKIVKPDDVSVLNDGQGKPATFDLITCDPPGTSLNRLVVTGEQISPDPSTDTASTAKTGPTPKTLPSNAPTLWSRLTSWLTD